MNTKLVAVITLTLLMSPFCISAQAQSNNPDTVLIYVVPDNDTGFSAKKTFLGKAVYSEDKKKIGTITDLVIAPDTSVAYVVVIWWISRNHLIQRNRLILSIRLGYKSR